METTVTMSLSRFKELEACEIVAKAVGRKDEVYARIDSYYSLIYTRDQIIDNLAYELKNSQDYVNKLIIEIRDYEASTGKKIKP